MKWKRVATSYWTAAALGLFIAAVHGWWLVKSDHAGEVISGFGAALVVLGLFVAARPFVELGVRGMAAQQVQAPQFTPLFDSEGTIIREAKAAYQKNIDAAVPAVIVERVLAVLVVVTGTLLNGYGAPLARLLGLHG